MAVFSEPPTWLKFVSPFPWFRPLGDYRNYQWIASITGSLIFVIAIFSQPVFVFLISGFNHGQSTLIQRIWMLGWLIANEVSVAIGLIVFWNRFYLRFYWHLTFFSSLLKTLFNWRILVVVMLLLLVYAFAIGGFVTVGAMLRAENYQLCNAIWPNFILLEFSSRFSPSQRSPLVPSSHLYIVLLCYNLSPS